MLPFILQAIEESVYVHEKFPLIIDPTGQAKMFLKYQTGSFITQAEFSNKELINRCLAGCIIHVRLLQTSASVVDASLPSGLQEGHDNITSYVVTTCVYIIG